jgi:hypothetical protein
VELCIQVLPMEEADHQQHQLYYLLYPPQRLPFQMRVTIWDVLEMTLKQIHQTSEECCLVAILLAPNQSDIRVTVQLSGDVQSFKQTDVHPRSLDGLGMFNQRFNISVKLPAPEVESFLKLQVWNDKNLTEDDLVAEAFVPMAAHFNAAYNRHRMLTSKRRPDAAAPNAILPAAAASSSAAAAAAAAAPSQPAVAHTYTVEKQLLTLQHPFSPEDHAKISLSVELLPLQLAAAREYRAAEGMDAQKHASELNAPAYVLPAIHRPETSFHWYQIDRQVWSRLVLLWHKVKWWLLLALVLIIIIAVVSAKAK